MWSNGSVPKAWIALVACLLAAAPPSTPASLESLEKTWREGREKRLTSPNGWLTLVGLAWLQPGDNAFGSDPANPVHLPDGKAPARAGVLVLADGKVTLKPAPGSGVTIDGKPAGEQVLRDDMAETTDVLKIGEVSFFVIRRGDRFGIRIKDPDAPTRTHFKGLEYFPMSAKWRVEATFVPYDTPRKVEIPTVLGTADTMEAPGLVKFTVDGKSYSLEPVVEDPNEPSLWFIFKDETSAKETYGAGRFLYAAMPKDGKTVIDFNQAYNPPCAFTPYATCPLPPKQNWLSVRVEAGEKAYAGGHEAH
jgi:uncharacterized protein (DUF1684 family)